MTQKLRQETLITLIVKVQQGNRLAYSQIVRQFQDLAVGYAYSILRNFSLAEEVAQEAFIEAYLNLDRLRNPKAFPSWFKKIVFKHCDRAIRGKRPSFVSLTQTEELISSQPSPLSIAEIGELQAKISRAIELLPETEREVVTLFYLGDRSQKEISAFLEIPISTIKNRLYSARNRLKPELTNMVENYLENQRPSQNDTFANQVTQILEAAIDGNKETIKTLIQQDTRLDDFVASLTPLQAAIESERVEITQILIEAGADVNTKTIGELELTPLQDAAAMGNLDLIRLLVKHQADLTARDNVYKGTPLDWAKAFEQTAAVELLEQFKAEKL